LAFALFCFLLIGVPAAVRLAPGMGASAIQALQGFDAFFRSGALVFGGGHVVLPLLQQQSTTVVALCAAAGIAAAVLG
ncbi:MAG: chromate ion family chromate transporter, partial [Burkholderiales bacterium]|nr:chromate ion family chromate transporter [Burkholderiales bacterium]